MSDETTPGPACLGPVPMTAVRRAEIREVLTGAGPSIPMGPNALFALRKDRDENRRAAVELLAEVDRLRALWADVAKIARDRKAEADGRRQHAEKLKAENEQLRKERDAAKAVEEQAVDYVDDLNQQIADAEKRAEQAEAERDVLADILVTQVQLHRNRHPDLGKRLCQTCDIFRELVETETFKAAEARLFGALLHAIETGNYVACPAPEDQSEDLDRGHDDLPAVREFVADFDPRGEST